MNTQIITLRSDDPRLNFALSSGWLTEDRRRLGGERVIARQVIEDVGNHSVKTVVFERIEQRVARPGGVGPWLRVIRAFSLTATATPWIAVVAWSWRERAAARGLVGLCALLGAVCLQIAINLFNDVEDYRRLIDLPGTLGGSGVIQSGWRTPAELKKIAVIALLVGAALGLPAIYRSSSVLLWIGATAALSVLLYSGKQFGLKYIALGDLAVWLLCGPLLVTGFYLSIFDFWNSGALWIGSFFGFLAVGILHVNNLQDMKLDHRRGMTTLAILLGFRGSLQFLYFTYFAAIASIVAGVWLQQLSVFALGGAALTAFFSAPWLKSVGSSLGPESSKLSNCRIKAAQIHLLSGIGLILSLALGNLVQ